MYEYQCQVCKQVKDRLELSGDSFDGPPECRLHGPMRKVILTAPQPQFVGEFSGGTRPRFKPDDRSHKENMQEAKIQKRNREEKQDRDIEKHIETHAAQWDFA